MFESRRWVELRKQSFKRQMLSAESTGMGIFYTLNGFCIQESTCDALCSHAMLGWEAHVCTSRAGTGRCTHVASV